MPLFLVHYFFKLFVFCKLDVMYERVDGDYDMQLCSVKLL